MHALHRRSCSPFLRCRAEKRSAPNMLLHALQKMPGLRDGPLSAFPAALPDTGASRGLLSVGGGAAGRRATQLRTQILHVSLPSSMSLRRASNAMAASIRPHVPHSACVRGAFTALVSHPSCVVPLRDANPLRAQILHVMGAPLLLRSSSLMNPHAASFLRHEWHVQCCLSGEVCLDAERRPLAAPRGSTRPPAGRRGLRVAASPAPPSSIKSSSSSSLSRNIPCRAAYAHPPSECPSSKPCMKASNEWGSPGSIPLSM